MSNSNDASNLRSRRKPDMRRVVVAGFIGGLMTPMIHPLNEFLAHKPSDFGAGYWFLGAGLGVLGAVLVWLLEETDVKKALALGLSLPAFFMSLGGAVQNTGEQRPGTTEESRSLGHPVGMFSLPSTAYAQEPTSTAPTAGPKRSVEISIDGQPFAYSVEILDAQGKVIGDTLNVTKAGSLLVAKPLSESAAALRFTAGGQSLTKAFDGKDGYTVEVTLLGTSFTRKFGVAQVLGKIPDLAPTGLAARIRNREKAPVGKQGWIYVGTLTNGRWDAEHTVEGTSIPRPGDTRQIVYSANLRDAAGSANPPLAVISVFQRVRFLQVTSRDGTTWAQVEVQA